MRYHCATPAQIVVKSILDRGQKASQGKRWWGNIRLFECEHDRVYCKTPPHPSPLLLHGGEGIFLTIPMQKGRVCEITTLTTSTQD